MSTPELVKTYSVVGDQFLVVLCVLLMVILRYNFIKNDNRFQLLKVSILSLFIAGICNILFNYVALADGKYIYLYILRGVYHTCLLSVFVIYTSYVCFMIDAPMHQHKKIMTISLVIWIIGSVLDSISPLLKFGFYRDSSGVWHDESYFKFFTITYAIDIAFIIFLFIKNRKRMIKSVAALLAVTISIDILLVVLENIHDSNSFLALTFMLPILVVLFEFHSSSYNIRNGSRDFVIFSHYLKSRYKSDKKTYFMCLNLYIDNGREVPPELGKEFYSFYNDKFSDAQLFSEDSTRYVLAIPVEKETHLRIKIKQIVDYLFLKEYEKKRIKYKMLLIEDTKFETLDEFNHLVAHYVNNTDMYTVKTIDADEMERYVKKQYIVKEIKDIHDKGNLEDERVLVYCQPVYNIETDNFDTAEALMRLEIPGVGMIYPDKFIPLAEEYGYIHTLTKIIFNKTCAAIRKMLDEGYKLTRISVNFSIDDFKEEDFIDTYKSIIQSNNIDYDMIGVEITESQNDRDYQIIANTLKSLHDLNTTIYLDDFGTGYSNMDRVLKLKFDIIKMDRSLLLLSDNIKNTDEILSCFSHTFSSMGYKVLYEGVETGEHEGKCRNYSGKYLQGYRYSKPIPIGELRKFLDKKQD